MPNYNENPLLINNIIHNFSEYLSFEDIKQFRLVCKIWNYSLLKRIGNSVKFNLKPNLTYLIEGKLLSLEVLSLNFIEDLKGLPQFIKGLEGEIWVNEPIFTKLNEYFVNLRSLDLMPPLNCMDKLNACLPKLENLHSLTIRHRYLSQLNNSDQCIYYCLPLKITHITIDYSSCTSLSYFPNLDSSKELDSIDLLINCAIKTKTELPFSSLNSIKIFKTNQLEHKLSAQLLSIFPNLDLLDIIGKCPSNTIIKTISNQNPSLTKLQFTSHLRFNISLCDVSLFYNLKELKLKSKLNYPQLVQLANSCTNLTTLQFILVNFTDSICQLFETKFNKLERLDVKECEFRWTFSYKWVCSNTLTILKINELKDLIILDWFVNLSKIYIGKVNIDQLTIINSKYNYLKFSYKKLIK